VVPASQIENDTMQAKADTMTGRKPSASPRLTKRERTRNRLTQAALRLMAARGINGTSVSEIAAEAELANGTFYLYFKDKAEIVAAVCQAVTLAMHNEMSSVRLSLEEGSARVAFGTQQFIEVAAAEPSWGRLLMSAFTEFEAIKDDISRYMRLDVVLGVEQGCFTEPVDEFVIDTLLAILRAGVSSRLNDGQTDAGARTAEYHLRVLGMSAADARGVRLATDKIVEQQVSR
jgi:AcrR family transcriptional regulator